MSGRAPRASPLCSMTTSFLTPRSLARGPTPGDDWRAHGHGFQRWKSEAFVQGRIGQYLGAFEQGGACRVAHRAGSHDPVADQRVKGADGSRDLVHRGTGWTGQDEEEVVDVS